jgi:hypothetical protein
MTANRRQAVQKTVGLLRLACASDYVGEQDRRNERFRVVLACSGVKWRPYLRPFETPAQGGLLRKITRDFQRDAARAQVALDGEGAVAASG